LNKEKIWTKGFTTITASYTLFSLGMYMLIPTIPLFLVGLGVAESQVGVVATAFYSSSILTRFFINMVIAKAGKKRVLVVGLIINTTIMALYSLAGSVGVVALLRVVQGMGLGTTSAIFTTIAVDILPDSRRGQGVGYFGLGVIVAMTIGPAIALFIKDGFGFVPMFLIAGCTNMIAAVTVIFFVEEPRINMEQQAEKQQEKPGEKAKTIQWRNLYDRRLILSSVIVFLFGICRAVDTNYIALFAMERKLEYLSWYFVIQTAAMFCIRFIMGRVADRKGRNWALIPGGFAMLALMITLNFTTTSAVMLLGAFFSGLGAGMLAPNLQVWILGTVEPSKRSVASSSYYNSVDIGSAIGAPLMGLMAENFGYNSMFRTGACAAVLYLVVYITVGREKRPKGNQDAA